MAKKRANVPLKFVMTADGRIIPPKESKARLSKIDAEREGEPTASFKSLLEADVVEELHLTIVPVIRGGEMPSFTGLPEGFLPQERCFRLKSLVEDDDVVTLHYLRDRGNSSLKVK